MPANKIFKAILVDVIDPKTPKEKAELRLAELENLVQTYGGIAILKTIQKRSLPDYSTYIGKGKVNEILALAEEMKADLVVINNLLKPRQTFNLTEIFREKKVKVWDRIDIILKIFSKHAKSTEAKLQIELASIKHMGPRIFNMGIELSRQGGATGMRAGQGESNIEMMKRHLRRQELKILDKLKHYGKIRAGHRKRRRRLNFKTAALVGYTNAGKTSLLNALTKKGAYSADKLFATLDTRVGKLYLPESHSEVLISDTIGFIQDLPPSLIESFKSTLSETIEADLILHVIDISDPNIHHKIEVVEEILTELGLAETEKIYVFNKLDLVEDENERDMSLKHRFQTERPPGILEAGKETARYLGWVDEEKKSILPPARSIRKIKSLYKGFRPVFISSSEKANLDSLKDLISQSLH